ncbi:Variable outer membrane protein (plasmid) [Borrelia crocidurae DOU]|uniref:Variable outer membrane protein n=1 Tax=Borrelia crocidurae DOU TaxID=1293575 RepID=W5SJD4_9SPIR|nr:Variable outer membrane protein [Borrelia crocidurae DOU]
MLRVLMMVVMGCSNGGVKKGEEGKQGRENGSVIDLKAG